MKQHSSLVAKLIIAILMALAGATSPPLLAHDFGGPSTGGEGPPEPPPDTPCDGDECVPDCEDDGAGNSNSPPIAKSGKPVSLFTGAETYSVTDLVIDGAFPIRLSRQYDSRNEFDSPLGFGWAWVFDRRLYEYSDGSVVIRHGCGNRDRFVLSGGAYVSPAAGIRGTLSEQPDGTFVFQHAHGLKDFYDLEGRLAASEDVRGNRLEYTYDPAGKVAIYGRVQMNRQSGEVFSQVGVTAYSYRVTRIDERAANGSLTGHYVTFAYGVAGRLATATTYDGRVISYGHERADTTVTTGECPDEVTTTLATNGNLRRVTYPDTSLIEYSYGIINCHMPPAVAWDFRDDHQLWGIGFNTYGQPPITIGYDSQNRVISQNVRGTQYAFEYLIPYARTRVTKTVLGTNGVAGGPGGYTAVSTYDFDSAGRMTKMTDALGNEHRYAYNSAKFLESQQVWQNNAGTLSLMQAKNWTYDGMGNMLTEVTTLDSGEVVTRSWTYDHGWVASEQVVSSAAPSKIFRTEYTFFYNAAGVPKNIHQVKRRRDDGSFQTITYDYDSRNRYKGTTYPDGVRAAVDYTGEFVSRSYIQVGGVDVSQFTETYQRDARGNITEVRDARNNLTTYTYDAMDRVTSVTNPLNEQTVYTFYNGELYSVDEGRTAADGAGQVLRFTRHTQTRHVTGLQRQIYSGQFVDIETYGINSEGDQVTITDAVGRTKSATYDPLGRMASVTDAANKTTTFGYDAVGNLTRITDALSRQTRFEYDDLNRRTAVVEMGVSPNPRTEFTYDADSNLTSVKDAEDRLTTYEFDALSRNTRITQPLGQQTQFFYDSRDRLDYLITARNQKIDYDYEAWGPLREEKQYATVSQPNADRTITYGYDNDGNVTSVADSGVQSGNTYSYTRDALGRPYDETVHYLPSGARTLQHRYDRFGYRNGLTLVDGTPIVHTYTVDRLDRLTNASLAGAAISFAYYGNDDVQTITLPNGVSRAYAYAANGPVNSISVNGPSGSIAQFTLTYDDLLNVDTLTDFDGLHDFGYDGLNRLSSASHPVASGLPANEGFQYTAAGNRKDSANPNAWTFDNNHRITGSPGLAYTYDADGNLSTRSDAMTMTHDARQRLVQVVKSGTTSSYLHDAYGRRIRKTVGSVDTWYLWDDESLLAEYNGSGTRTKRYAYLPDDYAPTQVEDANGVYYVHADHLDTPRLLTNAGGQVVWRGRHEAFGKATVHEDPDGNGVPVSFNLRFPGQYFDAETGLHYNLMRDYDPQAGRYLQQDPYGQFADANLYTYAANNPQNEIDPTGEILPAIAAYLRCVAQCTAWASLGGLSDPCFSVGDSAKDCAKSCLNPLNWLRFKGGSGSGPSISGLANQSKKQTKKQKQNEKLRQQQREREEAAKHRQGQSASKHDKHTKKRPGSSTDKKRGHDGWTQNPNKPRRKK